MKDDGLYLTHILECIKRVKSYTSDGRDSFMESTLIQDGVIRNLQVLSESSQRISDEIKQQYPDVDWRGLSGFRNILVHDYLGVDLNTIWQLIESRLSSLQISIETIVKDIDTKS